MSNEKLLPCPIPSCKGEAYDKGHGISCLKCGLWLGDGTQVRELGGIYKVWNTRPPANDADVVEVMARGVFEAEQLDPHTAFKNKLLYGAEEVTWEYINSDKVVPLCAERYRQEAQAALRALQDAGYQITKRG